MNASEDFNALCRALVSGAFEPMTVTDEGGVIAFENNAMCRLCGHPPEERVGRAFFEFVDPRDEERVRAAFGRARTSDEPAPLAGFRLRHRDGGSLPVESVMRFITVGTERRGWGLIHLRDVGERQLLETRLRHAHRLTALGRLTSGLADDFARVMATIRSHLHAAVEHAGSTPQSFSLRAITMATETGALLAQQLKVFVSTTPVFFYPVDVHALLLEIQVLMSDDVWLTVTREAARSVTRTDRESLRQALMDLVRAFKEAMPEGSVVAVTTKNLSFPERHLQSKRDAELEYLVIDITNTGRGVTRSTELDLFEPSWSMPASGPIMLALVVLHDIVTATGGLVEVASTSTGTTTVAVYLPV